MSKTYDRQDIASSTNMALNSLTITLLSKHVEEELPKYLEQYSIPKEVQEEPNNKKLIDEIKEYYIDTLYDYIWSRY